MANEKITFASLVGKVEGKELVLPDFQRKFVWDKDMMRKLYASVLCRMPLGSVLILNSSDDNFACKEIGAKKRTQEYSNISQNGKRISYLIDGQQRLTTLFSGFTTHFLEKFKGRKSEIASENLLEMFFIRIPSDKIPDDYEKKEEYKELDIFNAKKLDFNFTSFTNNSYFQSTIIQKLITSEKTSRVVKSVKSGIFDVKDSDKLDEVINYCSNMDEEYFYHIPLQFINNENPEVQIALQDIINGIAGQFHPMHDGTKDKKKASNWALNVQKYLEYCLSNIDLNQIVVENSDKVRAIDIYSNMNQGGVKLSVFDLILAKVGSVTPDNFSEKLIEYIQKPHKYPDNVYKDDVKNWISISQKSYNNASQEVAEVINEKTELITKEYENVFLNVLAMYITQKNRPVNVEFDVNCIKEESLLKLNPNQVNESAEKVCTAIDRALFFFQTRCGIRYISDINYKAQLAVVAYFFTDDSLFNNEKIHYLFEYWYWISIFAYLYPSNQNISIFREIEKFEKLFNKENAQIIVELHNNQSKVLDVLRYSDEETLTLSENRLGNPPSIMTNYICQFYMAKGYKDFWDDVYINFLYDDALDIHHILPLGTSPELKIGQSTKEIRNNPRCRLNSPLNMLLITKKSNKKISDMDYAKYSQESNIKKVLPSLGCSTVIDSTSDEEIEKFLKQRFDSLKSDLEKRLDNLYHCINSEWNI